MSEVLGCAVVDNKAWRKEPMTEKQADFIQFMEGYRFDVFPAFTGSTKGEATDYITRYRKTAYANASYAGRGY